MAAQEDSEATSAELPLLLKVLKVLLEQHWVEVRGCLPSCVLNGSASA